MRHAILLTLLLPAVARAQSLPTRLDELPRRASTWPPAWAALARDLADAPADFEKLALQRVAKLLQAEPTLESHRLAETVLSATLRHHLSVRRPAPLADNPGHAIEIELQDRLALVRTGWLQRETDAAEALRLAELWLPITHQDSPLHAAILKLWLAQGTAAIEKNDYPAARAWLDRLEAHFDDAPLEPLRKPIHERAQAIFKEALASPDAQAAKALEQALELWPQLPQARDELEKRKGTYRTLTVGVPALPVALSPATASTEVERQALALIFESLYHRDIQPSLGRRYVPQLADSLPSGVRLNADIALRRDAYWSSGERVTAADVRHTALLLNKDHRTGLWREFLEIPRGERSRFQLTIPRRQGLLDPLAPLTFPILPQYYRGKELARADDADFAKSPVGSGPFLLAGKTSDAGKVFTRFQANPHFLRAGVTHLREIRMVAFTDAKKDLSKPLPELILDARTDQLAALKALGYAERPMPASSAVFCLAFNQRKPALASSTVRRAIALGLDRQGLLNRHFRAGMKHHQSANGIFPRQSWAACPAPRVPAELYSADAARSLIRKLKTDAPRVDWTLKFPADDARVQAACTDMAASIAALLQEAGIQATVRPVALAAADLQKALDDRDFDLAYVRACHLDDPVRLALFFDPAADALKPPGSNFLGCDDVKLQELIQVPLKHRQFAAAQAGMHAIHAHLTETMPIVPLWQLDVHVLTQPALSMPPLQTDLFADISKWSVH